MAAACAKLHDDKVRGIEAKRIQADEIWSFVYAKQKNVPLAKIGQGCGDCWTWTAIDADTKLMIAFFIGNRSTAAAQDFMDDVAGRVIGRPQVTTDALQAYLKAVVNAFNGEVDHAVLKKIYGIGMDGSASGGRYSPAVCTGIEIKTANGNPDPDHISTSYVERSNLSMRMGMRRFTRLTNAHSKKIDNHIAMICVFFTFYNFCRVHSTTKKTPAVAAGLTDRTWSIADLVALI